MTSKRCQWVDEKDALMVQYHDTEWGVSRASRPEVI